MTTRYNIPQLWAGETVIIIGSAPTADNLVECHPSIVCSRASKDALWADMCVALDGNFPPDFTGLRVTGFEDETVDALYVHMPYERVTIAEGHEVDIRNSGFAAIRIAEQAGAVKIRLVSFDPESFDVKHGIPVMVVGLPALIAELGERGVVVEHAGAQEPEPFMPASVKRMRKG